MRDSWFLGHLKLGVDCKSFCFVFQCVLVLIKVDQLKVDAESYLKLQRMFVCLQVQYDSVLQLLRSSTGDISRLGAALQLLIALSFTLWFPAVLGVFSFTVTAIQEARSISTVTALFIILAGKQNGVRMACLRQTTVQLKMSGEKWRLLRA